MTSIPWVVIAAVSVDVAAPVLAPPPPVYAPPPAPPVQTLPTAMPSSRNPHDPWPIDNPHTWLTASDYPEEARSLHQQEFAAYDVAVDAKGRVTSCTMSHPGGIAALDIATCSLVTARAHFAPATDADNHPVAGTYHGVAQWIAPNDPPEPLQVVTDYTVETNATRSFCEVKSATGAAAGRIKLGLNPCAPGAFARPYRDAAGHPVRRRVTVTQTVTVEDAP